MNMPSKVFTALAVLILLGVSGCTSPTTKSSVGVTTIPIEGEQDSDSESASTPSNPCMEYGIGRNESKTSQVEVHGATVFFYNRCTGEVTPVSHERTSAPGPWPSFVTPITQSIIGAGGQILAADKIGDSRVKAAQEISKGKVEATKALPDSEGFNLNILNQGAQAKAGSNADSGSTLDFTWGDDVSSESEISE